MLNFLSIESAQLGADIASIVASSVLSIVLIVVTVVIAIQNNRLNKKSIYLPLRIELCKSITDYSKRFYDVCTKLITNRAIVTISDIEKSIEDLDSLNTLLFDAKLRIRSIFPNETEFWETITGLFKEAENLQDRMKKGKSQILNDMQNFDEEIQKLSGELIDILNNEENYKLLTKNLSTEMVAFLDSYKNVFNILNEKINYIEFIQSKK